MEGASAASIVGRRDFVVPASPAAKRHFKAMEDAGSTEVSRRWLNWKRQVTPVVYEDEEKTKVMVSYVAAEFNNWGLTVSNTPALTFVPTTIHGLENLVAYAKANNKRVRAAGYRHTWTPLFSEDNEIFVSMLDLKTANAVPDPSSILPDDPSTASNEFKVIQLADSDVAGQEGKKRVARIGAAVTNEELRRWSIRSGWTLPLNVIMVEITLGGSNAPICHGGGIRHKTLSDLVRKIEYIDANGVHQSVDDPAWLKAAAGSFGLLGVITHVTIELDKMSYAVMKPLKQDIGLAIPPPEGFEVPDAIKNTYTDADLEAARKAFVQKSEESYYSEFFWFPYQPQAFVNCWDNTDDDAEVAEYPSYPDTFSQWIQGWLGGVINDDPLWRALPGHWQSVILSSLAMLALPPQLGAINTEIHTHLINALHFRRGVQNMRVRDMELQIPIPPLASDSTKPDWSVVQRAWWDAIAVVYADARAPMRIALEMRIMGASDMIMAPQTGNAFGTASIEVLTTMPAVADGAWAGFVQEVADRWMAYEYEGEKINTRPHWAKEWDGMTVRGQPWREYLREVSYKDEIPRFKAVLAEIGAEQGWALEDLQRRFSNPLLDEIFFA
ncbi:hypothetical protein EDC01DRAFT_720032 [Geopyxis carbonaria]|nr:hypothetical protein EDC01DRAFT_720032 [Geopyxis carbonaria]